MPAPASGQSSTPIPVAGQTGDDSSLDDSYPEVGQPLADEVGTARAAEMYGYGRCRVVEVAPTADLLPTLRNGEWISMDGAQAGDWLGRAKTYPLPDSSEVVKLLDYDQDEYVMLLASQEMFSQLQRGVSAGATVHAGQVHDDVSPVKGSFILEFDDGLIASVAPCGFVDEVMPLYRHLQSSGRPVTDAGALLQGLIAGEQTPLLDELTDARPQPISTPAAPDGRFDRDIHPSGQTLPRTRLQLTVPPSWQELGGVICAEAPQGFSACSSVRQIAGGSPLERYIRSEAGADVSLVWSAEQVGPAFVPITLGTHALPDETPCGSS